MIQHVVWQYHVATQVPYYVIFVLQGMPGRQQIAEKLVPLEGLLNRWETWVFVLGAMNAGERKFKERKKRRMTGILHLFHCSQSESVLDMILAHMEIVHSAGSIALKNFCAYILCLGHQTRKKREKKKDEQSEVLWFYKFLLKISITRKVKKMLNLMIILQFSTSKRKLIQCMKLLLAY